MCSMNVSSSEYEVAKFEPRTSYGGQFLQLATSSTGGLSLKAVLNGLQLRDASLAIRILGPLSNISKSEILEYYQQEIPKELKAASNSAGNLHNPALAPLLGMFVQALESTSFYKELLLVAKLNGYKIDRVDFEKFTLVNGNLFVAEITFRCVKNA